MSDEFTLYPKNPLIQQFFAYIGRTDTIGSGVRILYKYTPIYSDGGKPELIEDDVFRIIISLDKVVAEADDTFWELFKELCRHYYGIYPEMITDQINAYREVWDTE